MPVPRKPLHFLGSSLEDLRAFAEDARRFQAALHEVQVEAGVPLDWKPKKDVGAGVKEIRVHDASGAFRVIYLTARREGVYVLHCFQKKTRKTRKADIELAASRLRQIGG